MSPRPGGGPNRGDLKRVATEIRKKRDLANSLDLAQRRQQVMLPPPPDLAGYEFASTYDPAADISGDFYDFVRLGERTVGVLIGDVSGHGIEAAIVMGMAKKALSIFARLSAGPAEVLVRGNDDLCADLDGETFLSAVYAVLDADEGRITFARAGHPRPTLFRPGAGDPHVILESRGMVMGMSAGAAFRGAIEEKGVDLRGGDVAFFYTDGLVEAHNRYGEQYGLDRALAVLEENGGASPAALLAAIRESVAEFRSGQEPDDDVTMIAFRRTR